MPAFIARRMLLLATLSLATASAAGCELTDSGDDKDNGPSMSELVVPKEVELVAQGRGQLSYKARADGRIYLHDATAEKTLYQTPVKRGQRFTIAPDEDRASLDGTDVFEGNMHTRNEHKIYFLPKR